MLLSPLVTAGLCLQAPQGLSPDQAKLRALTRGSPLSLLGLLHCD